MAIATRPQPAEHGMLIGGEWVRPERTVEVRHPYDGSVVGVVADATPAEVDRAIGTGMDASPGWAETPAWKRAELLTRAAELLEERADEVALVITAELGKPIRDSRLEASRSPRILRRAAEEAKRFHGEIIQMDAYPGAEHRFGFTLRVPLGPIVCITPFNFPLSAVLHKVAPALASGNTAIIKPASRTPLTALEVGRAFLDAGFPPGVVNVVTGDARRLGPLLVQDDRVKMVAFTGSAEVGVAVMKSAGYKRVQLELGSNAAMIVHHDGDVASAAKTCAQQGYSCAGQVCIAVQRVYVHDSVFDAFVEFLLKSTAGLRVGDPFDEKTDIGPMVSADAASRIEEWVTEATMGGARVASGGIREGALYHPTIVLRASAEMKVVAEEVFAPVVVPIPYRDLDEAFALVNHSKYGLQAGIFTRDLQTSFRAARSLHVGGVMVNDGPRFRVDHMPYGGSKLSGIGREGLRYAMEEMTEARTIMFNNVM